MKAEKASPKCIMLLLAFLPLLTFSMHDFCPHPEDIYPCKCLVRFSVQMSHTTFFCGGPNIAMSQVNTGLKALTERLSAGFNIEFKNLRIGKLDVGLLNGTQIHQVHIEDCTFEGFIDTQRKQGAIPPVIDSLDIYNSIHGNVELNLASLKLNYMTLSNNVIKNLEIDWPIQSTSLISMSLINNSIESVGEDTFAPLSTISILDMSMNRLRALGKELRPSDPRKLSRAIFSRNQISSISKYYFYNMPSLKYVSLSYNQIQVLSEKTWKLTWSQLIYINLEENPLNCGAEIKWIQGPQPETVRGTCSTPGDKKSKKLSEVIKENNRAGSYLPEMLLQGSFLQGQ